MKKLPAFVTSDNIKKKLNAKQAYDFVEKLNLTEIRKRVSNENPKWTKKRLDEAEQRYRGFLFVCSQYDDPAVPDVDIDEFWHAHILYTKKYMDDCNAFFGNYMHHNPE